MFILEWERIYKREVGVGFFYDTKLKEKEERGK